MRWVDDMLCTIQDQSRMELIRWNFEVGVGIACALILYPRFAVDEISVSNVPSPGIVSAAMGTFGWDGSKAGPNGVNWRWSLLIGSRVKIPA